MVSRGFSAGAESDSFDTRRYMRSIFAPFCTVVEARDGLEALEACQRQMPDLVVTDVMMPNVSKDKQEFG